MEDKKREAYRLGLITLGILAVLTLIEYVIAINFANPAVWLIIIALVKTGAIVQNFMHIARLWREESHS